jgi:hypothetical protein
MAFGDWANDGRVMSTPLSRQLVLVSAIEQEATDYAIDALCGEVTWGVCDARLVRSSQR